MFAEKTQAMVIERDKTGRSLEIAGTWKQWQECGNNFEVIFKVLFFEKLSKSCILGVIWG